MTAGLTKQYSSILLAFSMWPCFINFSISFSTDCCKCIGMGLPFCCINLASSFSCIFTSSPFTVWFSLNSFLNFVFSFVTSGSFFIWCICGTVVPVSSVIPNFFIQSKPSKGFVFLVVTRSSSSFRVLLISTFAAVFPSNRIGLSFTSRYSVSKGCNGVNLLNCDFGINVTGEPLSIMNLIGRLLTNAVIVKNSGPLLLIDRVECIFCFTEWIVFGVQSSSTCAACFAFH